MPSYAVQVFVPQEHVIEAKDEEEALEKVAALYKALYKKAYRPSWIEQLQEPEDEQ